ncbi:NADP-dependent oxidoreductase [Bacillus sp. HNG]|uniref:NADP-dependent oxidoreductase n=1 Tax=Bacillus sp. HNG TaxID=2293325 RepID=UPI000E2F307F|nr:NADP-dependent oxidoreductase [Bacillus sp. HNG]RFB14937.1 NADP-dependent oxidoreductase [Bacillus sp. HNG]
MINAIRVYQYGGPEELKYEKILCPEPKEGEVLIRVHSVGVLPVDWKLRQGLFKEIRSIQFPYIPGSAFSGVVEEVGVNVTTYRKGQQVFGRSTMGTYAEYIVVSKESLVLKPPSIHFDDAATISGGAATAWQALIHDGKVKAGQRVLIHGAAGGVGSYAVQFAKWKGAHVIGTASPANTDFVRSLGAETVIDYTSTPFEEVVKDVDLVMDTVGGDTLERSWSVVKSGGTLISLLEQPSLEKAKKHGIKALKPNRLSSIEDLKEIAQLMEEGIIKAVILKTFPLHEARRAHELSQIGHGRGRIILHIEN